MGKSAIFNLRKTLIYIKNLEARVGIEPAYTELQPGFSGDYLLLFIIMLHCLM